MRVAVFEDNLMWSARLIQSLKALGHEPTLVTKVEEEWGNPEAAIVNLGSSTLQATVLVPQLHEIGAKVIGHAGHKEKDLLTLGAEAGCDTVATNSELTFKLQALLENLQWAQTK